MLNVSVPRLSSNHDGSWEPSATQLVLEACSFWKAGVLAPGKPLAEQGPASSGPLPAHTTSPYTFWEMSGQEPERAAQTPKHLGPRTNEAQREREVGRADITETQTKFEFDPT